MIIIAVARTPWACGARRSLLAEVIMFVVISGLPGPDASDRGLARLHPRRLHPRRS